MHIGGKGGNRPNSREKGLYLKFTCLALKGEFFISSLVFQGGQTRCLQSRGTRGAGLGNCRGRARVDSAFLPGLPEGGDAFSLIRLCLWEEKGSLSRKQCLCAVEPGLSE